MTAEIMDYVNENVYGIWFLIGAALVFWMQAGFAMVETGFTRAKNAGNILMKNLMDFCIGTIVFILIGFGFLLGEDLLGLIGKPGFDIFTAYENFDWSNFVFNLVFCATAATIVSGAMAERTRFLSYCIYSAVISALIYPIEAHWVWGGGWLAQIGFHDFAGSACIHMVGGLCAFIGAWMLGPRIGKFVKNKEGKVVKVNAFPGHNLPIGALGVFILWLGWYGFNGAAATSVPELGSVFLTTTVAPSVATVVCMIVTWIKYGKPDVSMCLNASLAGLVAITAGCDVTDALGAIVIGGVAGVLVVFGVWLLDHKLHVDDPVGAVAVHLMNGVWGTLAVGLFATPTAPGVCPWLRRRRDLRRQPDHGCRTVLRRRLHAPGNPDHRRGGDSGLHGRDHYAVLPCNPCDGGPARERAGGNRRTGCGGTRAGIGLCGLYACHRQRCAMGAPAELPGAKPAAKDEAVPVADYSTGSNDKVKMSKVTIVTKQSMFERLKSAMDEIGVTGMTVTQVLGCGMQKGRPEYYRGVEMETSLLPKIEVDIVVCKIPVRTVIDAAKNALYTGHIGDGKIFVYDVEQVVKVRTGEEGYDALQDVE